MTIKRNKNKYYMCLLMLYMVKHT